MTGATIPYLRDDSLPGTLCLFFYLYFLDPRLGFGHVRLQSWLPFQVQVCLNGREWLARQMDTAGLGYRRADNAFLSIDDPAKAQRLMDRQVRVNWPTLLDRLLRLVHPLHNELFPRSVTPYYWTTYQMEWATDVYFRKPADLKGLYPLWVRHAMCHLGCDDVLRFLGKKLKSNFAGEVTSDCRSRIEGVRVKHRVGKNSVKIYDKAPHILRVETTLHDVSDLKTYRPKEGDPKGPCTWRPMRKGIADLHRATKLSQASNDRYLDALATVDPDDATQLHDVLRSVARHGRGAPPALSTRSTPTMPAFSKRSPTPAMSPRASAIEISFNASPLVRSGGSDAPQGAHSERYGEPGVPAPPASPKHRIDRVSCAVEPSNGCGSTPNAASCSRIRSASSGRSSPESTCDVCSKRTAWPQATRAAIF